MKVKFLLTVCLVLTMITVSKAQVFYVDDRFSRGKYDSLGETGWGNENYLAGSGESGDFRNYFVFNLASIPAGTVVFSAELQLYNPAADRPFYPDGFRSSDPIEEYTLFSVDTTSIQDLKDFTPGTRLNTYNDLGEGTIYGSIEASSASNGQYLSIALNSSFVSYAQSMIGQEIALGGALTTLDTNSLTSEYLFAGSDQSHSSLLQTRLILITSTGVPEPSGSLLAGCAAGLVFFRRRCHRGI